MKFKCHSSQKENTKYANFTKRMHRLVMHRLVCSFAVCMQQNQVFIQQGLYFDDDFYQNCLGIVEYCKSSLGI